MKITSPFAELMTVFIIGGTAAFLLLSGEGLLRPALEDRKVNQAIAASTPTNLPTRTKGESDLTQYCDDPIKIAETSEFIVLNNNCIGGEVIDIKRKDGALPIHVATDETFSRIGEGWRKCRK